MSPRLRKGLSITLAVVLILVLGASGFGVFTARRSFPQVSGSLQLPGLEAPVEVYRDSMGVPHIYADSEHDLLMAQGFLHAQDRFWQMDFWRHIGSGRLAEMFGDGQVGTDTFLRTLGWARVAQEEIERMSPENLALFQDYADGVNAYLAGHQGAALSLEYAVLGLLNPSYTPEPWTPLHTLTWAKAMAWDLGGNMDAEIQRALLLKSVGQDGVAALFPPYPESQPVILPNPAFASAGERLAVAPSEASTGAAPALSALRSRAQALDHLLGGRFSALGSNNWVISGERTTTGMPLLANDPHLGIQMPSIWYEVGLHCRVMRPSCGFDVVGFSFAGAPGVVIGHNNRIAWGVTNVGPDVQDLFIERVNPSNPNQYEVDGDWVDMDLVQEVIQVAGGDPVEVTVRYTRHGPIVSDVVEPLEDFANTSGVEVPANYAVALRWTALQPSTVFRSVLEIDRAQNWDEFRQALRDWDVPSQNFVYADVDGNIGYQMPGAVPIRAAGDGRLPVPGWTDEFKWTGTIPFDELPSSFNPPQGYIATANNAVVGPDYPHMLSSDWDYGYRAARIVALIEGKPKLSIEDIQAIQGDNFNAMGPVLVPLLSRIDFGDAHLNELRDMLSGWDAQNDMDSAPAALFNAFWHHLVVDTFADQLDSDSIPGDDRAFLVVSQISADPGASWWDDTGTQATEDRDDILRRAFGEAAAELEKRLGQDAGRWTWGALHSATFANQTLGQSGVAPIEALFNRGPFAASGGASIVNATGWPFDGGYEVRSLPSMRMIVDLSDLGNSLSIHTTGQSGHAYHAHYIDMADLWRLVQYQPMLWTLDQVEAAAESKLTLTP